MKNLSISNIAWSSDLDKDIINILKDQDISKIEIALTKINGSWNITKKDLKNFKNKYIDFEIYSIQSLNYNSEYNLFENNKDFLKHIYFVIECAKYLDSKVLVFGSPKNRFLPSKINKNDGEEIFLETMFNIGNKCKENNISFCIEPNSKKYNCNYITNSTEAFNLIKKINHNNILLHLDAACMHMEGDLNILNPEIFALLKHYHISEPFLNNFSDIECDHKLYSDSLKKYNYNYTKSIEMKYDEKNYKENIINSINFAKTTYF